MSKSGWTPMSEFHYPVKRVQLGPRQFPPGSPEYVKPRRVQWASRKGIVHIFGTVEGPEVEKRVEKND